MQGALNAGNAAWEICRDELGDSCCLLPGCSLDEVLYYISAGAPVMAVTDTGSAVLIVGYDAQNIVYYEPGQSDLRRAGMNDSSSMFETAGNLFFTGFPVAGRLCARGRKRTDGAGISGPVRPV